ncbi:hypothetical protein QFZ98_002037 [Paraburkholderia youngii]
MCRPNRAPRCVARCRLRQASHERRRRPPPQRRLHRLQVQRKTRRKMSGRNKRLPRDLGNHPHSTTPRRAPQQAPTLPPAPFRNHCRPCPTICANRPIKQRRQPASRSTPMARSTSSSFGQHRTRVSISCCSSRCGAGAFFPRCATAGPSKARRTSACISTSAEPSPQIRTQLTHTFAESLAQQRA